MAVFLVKPDNIKNIISDFSNIEKALRECQATINSVSNSSSMKSSSLQKLCGKVKENGNQVENMASVTKTMVYGLEQVLMKYEEAENKILCGGTQITSPLSALNNTVKSSLLTINSSELLIELEKRFHDGRIDESVYNSLVSSMGIDSETRDIIEDILKREVSIDTLMTLAEKSGVDKDVASIAKDIMNNKVDYGTFDNLLKSVGVSDTTRSTFENVYDMVCKREGIVGKMIDSYYSGPYAMYEEKMDKGDYLGALVEYSKGFVIIPCGVVQAGSQVIVDTVKTKVDKITKKIDKIIPDEIFYNVSKEIKSVFGNLKNTSWNPESIIKPGKFTVRKNIGGGGFSRGGGASRSF